MHNILLHLGAAFLWTLVILAYVASLCAIVGETKREGEIRVLREKRFAKKIDANGKDRE